MKNVWIKRGDYVVVEPILEGDKVKAEIVQILYKEQIKYIKEQSLWPKEFSDEKENEPKSFDKQKIDSNKRVDNNELESDEESDDESDIFQNTNRPKVNIIEESSDSSSSEDEQ